MPKSPQRRPLQIRPHRSLLWRVAAYMLTLSLLAVGTLSCASYFITRSYVEQGTLSQLAALAAAKEDLITERMQYDREYTVLLSARGDVLDMIETGNTDGLELLFFRLLDEEIPVVGISLFDERGERIAGIGDAPEQISVVSNATQLVPLIGESGWDGHSVVAQVRNASGVVRGAIAVHYDATGLRNQVLSVDTLGPSAEVLIGREEDGELVLVHHTLEDALRKPLHLGSLEEQHEYGSVLAQALMHEEGVHEAEDYRGIAVFASYRYLPVLGWGLVVKVDRAQALAGVFALGATLAVVSIVLLALTCLLAVVIARNITEPLRTLSKRVLTLSPGHWSYRKSVHTGDEVEVLDRVTADLAKRLKVVYEHLEEEVQERTAELKEQYEKDRTILESIQHGIVVVDAHGKVTAQNAAAKALIGCKEGSCLSEPIQSVLRLHMHKREVREKQHPVLKCLRSRKIVRSEPDVRWSILHKEDNVLVPITLAVTPVLKGRKLLGAIAVFYDITEERRVDYLKSEFISLASHQLRTPLSTLQWYIELFTSTGEKKLSGSQEEYLKEMDTASKRMSKLVDALLHAARLEGKAIKPNRERMDLREFMEDMSEELRSLAKASKISCVVNIPQGTYIANTDPILLHIVFQNLFSNAVKYTLPGGQVEIGLQEMKDAYELIVSDSGIGIPKKDQKRIFERLFRADNVKQMDTDGSGLGLYISRMVMDTLGGGIRFRSSEKKGTVFIISIPKRARKTPKK